MDSYKKVLITGAAGFIGFHLSKALLERGITVIGIDNLNDYYDIKLKELRLKRLKRFTDFHFTKGDISDSLQVAHLFKTYQPDIAVNLAAQAGVRYSIENPRAYIDSNIIGFFNILEACRHYPVKHLLFASSSSVYGNQVKVPFSVGDHVDYPVSLYAATKKSNELMSFTYSHLYQIPTTGLRFFTVYGPFGRPDMAYYSFTQKILSDEPIEVFNNGHMLRDFTYIDDIVLAVLAILKSPPAKDSNGDPYKLYNIGNSKPEHLMHLIKILEKALQKKATIKLLPMQPGDVYQTYADISDLEKDFGIKPRVSLEDGLTAFVKWYLEGGLV